SRFPALVLFPYPTLFRFPLDRRKRPHHLMVPAAEPDPPSRHVVRLRHRRKFHAHILRSRRSKKRRRLVPPKIRLAVRKIRNHQRSEEHTSELQSLAYLVC